MPFMNGVHHLSRNREDSHPDKHREKKRRSLKHDPHDSEPGSRTVGKLKGRIRDLSRELQHKLWLPATVRRDKEREIQALRYDLRSKLRHKERSSMISKYHRVRFFERQKASRDLKKAQKAAEASSTESPDREALVQAVHEAEVNINYTMFFPLMEKYVSLFDTSEGTKKLGPGYKSPMWHEIEAAMKANKLQELREREPEGEVEDPSSMLDSTSAQQAGDSRSRDAREQQTADFNQDEEMSDDGFFEKP